MVAAGIIDILKGVYMGVQWGVRGATLLACSAWRGGGS